MSGRSKIKLEQGSFAVITLRFRIFLIAEYPDMIAVWKNNFFSPYLTGEYPVWWYTAPAIIRTFLEVYDFSGKVIVPFATSGGSGLGDTAKTLQKLVPAAAVKDGKLLNGRLNAGELKKWADSFEN